MRHPSLVAPLIAERRSEPRSRGHDLPTAMRARVRPGHIVRIVDLSARGALIETERRLLPGSHVELRIETASLRHVTRALVVRCQVSVVRANALVYRGAVEFERRLDSRTDIGSGSKSTDIDPDEVMRHSGMPVPAGSVDEAAWCRI